MSHTSVVLVLMGGPDAEREVSLCSGREVAAALRRLGRFGVVEGTIHRATRAELEAMAHEVSADVIFPVLHGHWGEGGPLQELLEAIGLPYVGSQPGAAALAMDKLKTKAILAREGVQTPASQELVSVDERCVIEPPLVIKPVDDGSSVDLRICRTAAEMEQARRQLHAKRGRLMAETYIKGREITAGIICGRSLPLIEIIPSDEVEFYDYDAKYARDDTRYVIGPELSAGVAQRCVEIGQHAYGRLGCRDIARVDIMVDDRGPWFLEINTMPGFTTHSLVPMAAREVGIDMPRLCGVLVEEALGRRHAGRTETKPLDRVLPEAVGIES